MRLILCHYCFKKPKLVNGDVIYPHRKDLYHKQFYLCISCNAYVGCHSGTDNPLGRLANLALRTAKMNAHAKFDPLWKAKAKKERLSYSNARNLGYEWLAKKLKISFQDCHIGLFNIDMCENVVNLCKDKL